MVSPSIHPASSPDPATGSRDCRSHSSGTAVPETSHALLTSAATASWWERERRPSASLCSRSQLSIREKRPVLKSCCRTA